MGEKVQLGVGVEVTRGTPVAPAAWIPARTPSGIVTVLEKVQIKETKGAGIASQGSEITQKRVEGDLEFNVRNKSFGYILKSLLGTTTPVTALGATTHTFTRQTTGPQHPGLTLALAQPGQQHYEYALGFVNALEIRTPVDDLVNATASFLAKSEATHADYTPAVVAEDEYFRNSDVVIKFAANVAGLAGASAVGIKEFSLNINNNGRVNQVLGSLSPNDVLALLTEISGSFTTDFEGVATYYDIFKAGTYKAMSIAMERTDLPVLGTSALKPKIEIILPKVSFDGYSPDRPLDDIVTEGVEFTAHYDDTDGAIKVILQNEQATY